MLSHQKSNAVKQESSPLKARLDNTRRPISLLWIGSKRVQRLLPSTTSSVGERGQMPSSKRPTVQPATAKRAQVDLVALHRRHVSGQQNTSFSTREEWLEHAIAKLNDQVFARAGYPVPKVKVTIGFPSKRGAGKKVRRLGQCWSRSASGDGLNQIFLNPTLASADKIVDVLSHELVHAVDDCQSGHRGIFQTICKAVDLTEGRPTTASAGPDLRIVIGHICRDLGPLPHAPLQINGQEKPQGTRLRKIECPACGYKCRTTAVWLAQGLPTCPCGTRMLTEEQINATAPTNVSADHTDNANSRSHGSRLAKVETSQRPTDPR